MQVACCQFDIAWEDKPANFRKVAAMVREAELEPGTLLLLPEMFATGFSMNAAATDRAARTGRRRRSSSTLAAGTGSTCSAASRSRTGRQARATSRWCSTRTAEPSPVTRSVPVQPAGEGEYYAAGERHRAPSTGPAAACRVRSATTCGSRNCSARAAGRGGPVHGDRQLAGRPRRPLDDPAAGAGDREPGVRGRVQPLRHGPKVTYSGRSQIIDPPGEVVADAGGDERIIRADVNLSLLREYRQKLPFLARYPAATRRGYKDVSLCAVDPRSKLRSLSLPAPRPRRSAAAAGFFALALNTSYPVGGIEIRKQWRALHRNNLRRIRARRSHFAAFRSPGPGCLLALASPRRRQSPETSGAAKGRLQPRRQPILSQRCQECHGPSKQKGGLRLDSKEHAFQGGDSGDKPIVPGDPEKSKLIHLVRGDEPDEIMPPKGDPLTAKQIDTLKSWIQQGATGRPARPPRRS